MKVHLVIFTAALTLLLASCVNVGDGSSSELPWTQPADWENTTLGIPM